MFRLRKKNKNILISYSAGLVTLGRHRSNDLVLDDHQASNHHAVIFTKDHANYFIRDLSSKNHTIVNGEPVALQMLGHEDSIKLGNTVLIFQLEDQSHEMTGPPSRVRISLDDAAGPGQDSVMISSPARACRDRSRLQKLYEIATAVNSSLDSQIVFQKIIEKVSEILKVERAFLALQDEPGGPLHFEAVQTPEGQSQTTITLSRKIIDAVIREGKAILIHDALDDPRFRDSKSVVRYDIRSVACAPLQYRDAILGILYIDNRSRAGIFNSDDLEFLLALGQLAAVAINNARLFGQVKKKGERLERELQNNWQIIACSPAIRQIIKNINLVAATELPVLITGESGTGKELVARRLHCLSPRSEGPFLAVNCASITESLAESELFGICRGAASGVSERPGLFEQAQGGTLLLDEVGEMPLAQQAKLLRVLEEKTISRVGGCQRCSCRNKSPGSNHTAIPINARIIAATNKNLAVAVREGHFRHDLYHRLNVFPLHIPPLRERPEDIPLLATFIFDEERLRLGKSVKEISYEAMRWLRHNRWQGGNVRELRSDIQRALILCEGQILQPKDFSSEQAETDISSGKTLREVMRLHILQILEECGGNKTKAAMVLGISPATLYNKLHEYGLNQDRSQKSRGGATTD